MDCDLSYDAISSLRDCLVQLEQGKVTERKEQIVKLKNILKRNDVLQLLDKNSGGGRRRSDIHWQYSVTWAKIFIRVTEYIRNEAERIGEREAATENPSRMVIDNRTKEKKSCSDFFKYIVKIIVSRGQYTLCTKILDHIMGVLSNSYTLPAFGLDYTNILLKEILLDSHVHLQINVNSYQVMIKVYIKLIKNPPQGWDRSVLAQVLYHLLLATYNQCDLKPQRLFEFFSNMFAPVKFEKANRYHEYLLKALLLVSQNCAVSCRVQLCSLGESILTPLMQLWKTKPTDAIKELMFEFCLLQLTLHHPRGAVEDKFGAFIENSTMWKTLLINLYHLIIKELNELCEKNRYSTSKDLTLHPYFIAISVEVCAQVFQDTYQSIEVTQIACTYESSQIRKKRRVEVGFKVFIEALQSFSSHDLIPWLHLMAAFLKKYPKIVSLSEISSTINLLIEKHLSCKQIEVRTWLLTSCCAAVDAFCAVQKIVTPESDCNVSCDWWRLWELGVRCVSLMHQCHETGHKLLSTLLLNKLVIPKAEFFSLYCAGSNNKPSRASMTTISIYMHGFLPPSVIHNSQNVTAVNQNGRDWFHYQVLNWLFANDDSDETENVINYLCGPDVDMQTVNLAAYLLASICMQDYKPLLAECVLPLTLSNDVSGPVEWISNLEKDLLHCTLDLPFTEYNKIHSPENSISISSLCSNLITPVWQKMNELMENLCLRFFDTSSTSMAILDTNAVHMKLACIIFLVVKQLVLFGALDKSQLFQLSLTVQIKNLVSSSMEQVHWEETSPSKSSFSKCNSKTEFLTFLSSIMNTSVQENGTLFKHLAMTIANWSSSLIPSDLEKILFEAVKTDVNKKQQNISESTDRTLQRKPSFNQTDIDDEFFCPGPSTQRQRNQSVADFDMLSDDDDDMNVTSNGGSNGQSDNNLVSDVLKFQLQCVESINSLLKLNLFIEPLNFESTSYIEQFLKVAHGKSQNIQSLEDITVALKILESILKLPELDIRIVKHVLSDIRSLLNKHSKNRTVCIKIISLFESIYSHIFSSTDSTAAESQKKNLLHLLNVLWQKEQESKLGLDVSIALADALCHLIEVDNSIEWKNEQHQRDDSETGEVQLVKNDVLSLFQCERLKVRLFMATHLKHFFRTDSSIPMNTKDQIEILEKNYEASVSQLKDLEKGGQQAADTLRDEKLNYGASLLYLLCNSYICGSNLCRKHALFMIFRLIKDSFISETLGLKAFVQIRHILKYDTLIDLVEHDIIYVFHHWIVTECSFQKFPWMVLEFNSSQEFFITYYEKLVPLYVYHSDMQSIKSLAVVIDLNVEEILVKCFPSVLARVYSWQVSDPENACIQQCIRFLEENVPQKALSASLELYIGEIFISLFQFLKEPSDVNKEMSQTSCACLSCISPEELFSSIELFKTKVDVKNSFVQFLCSKQDSLQNVLLSIHTHLTKSQVYDDQCHALLMYKVLLNLLKPELGTSLQNFITYILTEYTYSLINFIVKNKETSNNIVLENSIKLLHEFCDCVLPVSIEDIGKLLPFIVSRLIPFVSDSSFGEQVYQLLTYLIVDRSNELEEYIVLLDPFPDKLQFQNMRKMHNSLMYKNGSFTLEMELDHFNKSFLVTERSTLEGIRHLYKQLRVKQKECFQIITDLQEKNLLSEDIKNSKLHQLICILVFLCTPGNSEKEIQLEAGRCLGEIGPVDLSTIILQVNNREMDAMCEKGMQNSAMHRVYYHILKLLSDYLKDSRLHVKIVVTNVLKNIFKTDSAQELVASYKGGSWLEHLYPFYSNSKVDDTMDTDYLSVDKVNEASLWVPNEGEHSKWICNLVCTILESGITGNLFFQQLTPICKEEPAFCSQVLPYLIHTVVLGTGLDLKPIISNHVSSFFSKLSEELEKLPISLSSTPVTPSSGVIPFYACKASVQTMLSVVNYLRLQESPCVPENVCSNSWTGLDLDYLLVAQAAQYCSAHFSAILYAELWWNSVREKNIARSESAECNFESSQDLLPGCTPMTILNAQSDDRVALMHKIVLEAYSSIGEPDGIHGCIEIATDMQSVLLSHYTVEKKWNSLLNLYDVGDYNPGILKALKNCGLNQVLNKYIESQALRGGEPSPQAIEYQYECAWRMNQWEEPLSESENPGFQECFYKSLDCLRNQNKNGFVKQLEISRCIEFENLSHTSLESLSCILPMLSHLQMLSVTEDYANVKFNSSILSEASLKWEDQLKIPCAEFEFHEPVSWLQCILLKQHLEHCSVQDSVAKDYVKCLLQHCVRARQEKNLEIASKAVNVLKESSLGNSCDILGWQVEEAKILWAKNEPLVANHILKSVLSSMEKIVERCSDDTDSLNDYARTLTLKGKWSAETCSESSTAIMENYLQKAIDILEKGNISKEEMKTSDAYLAVARYADSQYQSIINSKNSTNYQLKQEIMKNSLETIGNLSKKGVLTEDQKRTIVILKRNHTIDEQELKNLDAEQGKFLMKAILGYLTCLRQTDAYDLWIFRLTALWFHNLNDRNINQIISLKVGGMEKYKFLPLMYQLAARMGSHGNKQFSDVLGQLIKDIALGHPHHALPIILSMSNADEDPIENATPVKKKDAGSEDSARKDRTAAAKKLVAGLLKTNHRNLVQNLSKLCDAYISLAYMPVDAKRKTGKIPEDMKIMKLKNLKDVPVITETIKVDRSCQYSNIIGIHSFLPEFRLCGGITVPKVIICVGTDGIKREQLVKSRDDLRQDAVMQQVFSLVNCLLKENNETKRRKLSIRTYKVVPLSRRSGVLQWCEGTRVLSQYLIGPDPTGGAHKKYYRNFWPVLQCVKKMREIAGKTPAEKRKVFDIICSNFPPVFRYFFLENFPDPSAWFERKQCYTKSVATSSIVGYILGLGDRHVNNILVDKRTAEVVHIDFGIAFEKGRILATPETVPFRLTRDIVDGMGFIGLEGVFKRCSEKTMEVMRNSQDVLLTILEVLLYDPLYDWSVPITHSSLSSPMKAGKNYSPKSVSGQEVNKLAERALMRLQQKLQGLEEGMTLSVSGQVNMLIQQARDPNNLCRLYAGWQPYL